MGKRCVDILHRWHHPNPPLCRFHVLLLQGQPEREVCGLSSLIWSLYINPYHFYSLILGSPCDPRTWNADLPTQATTLEVFLRIVLVRGGTTMYQCTLSTCGIWCRTWSCSLMKYSICCKTSRGTWQTISVRLRERSIGQGSRYRV